MLFWLPKWKDGGVSVQEKSRRCISSRAYTGAFETSHHVYSLKGNSVLSWSLQLISTKSIEQARSFAFRASGICISHHDIKQAKSTAHHNQRWTFNSKVILRVQIWFDLRRYAWVLRTWGWWFWFIRRFTPWVHPWRWQFEIQICIIFISSRSRFHSIPSFSFLL